MKKALASCGTRSGYNRHLRLKEEVCDECRQAQREYDRNRFYKNPELKRQRNRKYVNLEKKRSSWRRRQAKRLQNDFEKYTEKQVLEKYGNLCHICNKEIDLTAPRRSGMGENWEAGLHIDHLIPVSEGGPDTLNNVRPAHGLCNIRKGNRV